MKRYHQHPCRYCETPLRCDGEPEYACGFEGAYCSELAADPHAFVCDTCADIVWCGVCGEIEVLDGSDVCVACVEDDDVL